MLKPLRKQNPLLTPVTYSLIDLPAPSNLSFLWNFGSLLGLCLSLQLTTGLMLAMFYTPNTSLAFSSIAHITRDVYLGWLIRNLHANSASIFFLCLYLHMGRSMYYNSYKNTETWNLGVTIFILMMATAFMGYLLPWGQMSFWGATVITNLFSAIPYVGKLLVEWLWGGFGVTNATLTRFFALHFMLPFLISGLVIAHLLFLHQTGSNNPLGILSNPSKSPFHVYYTIKDILGLLFLTLILSFISFFHPNLLTDPENFIPANPLSTPTHIKPEWYFLWAYAILRSIPNKLGGVVALFSALLLLYLLPLMQMKTQSSRFTFFKNSSMWMMITTTALLTWIGSCPVEPPYETIGLILTTIYFISFGITPNIPIYDILLPHSPTPTYEQSSDS